MAEERKAGAERWFELDRLVGYSDGVFAIAMTLLVLTLNAPELHGDDVDGQLRSYLRDQIPNFVGFALSFFIVARYWIAHHRLFQIVRRSDPKLIMINLVVLFLVVLVPYPTELFGDYPETTTATVLYSAALAATGLSMVSLTWYAAVGHRLIDPAVSDRYITHALMRGASIPVVFIAAIPVAFVNAVVAKYVWLLIIPMRMYFKRRYGPIHDPF
ncbi:MAG: TMEM175 family protein [Acidimicrobiia bacterium]